MKIKLPIEKEINSEPSAKISGDKDRVLQEIFENAPDTIVVVNEHGQIEHINAQVREIFGYQPEELSGQPVEILIPERFHHKHKIQRQGFIAKPRLRSMGAEASLFGRRKDGSEFPVEIMLSPISVESGKFVIGVIRDITERTKAEVALHKSELQLRSIMQTAVDAIIAANADGNIISWNKGAENIFGYKEEEVLGKPLTILMPEEYRQAHQKGMERFNRTEQSFVIGQTLELTGLRKNGQTFPIQLSLNTWKTREGRFYSGIIRDITEQKYINDELEKARDAALNSARLKAEFLANMSHEIRTPMNGVIGMTGLLLDTALDNIQRDYAETIQVSAETLLRIIDDILDFSKIEAGRLHFEKINFDLVEIIESTLELHAEKAFSKDVELISFIQNELPYLVCGDPVRLGQVIANLVSNAIKFTEKGSVSFNVMIQNETPDKVDLYFEVKDTGIGIEKHAQEHLFQAFMQADGSMTRKYGGTGLGLAISKQLVEMMNGEIGVESETGEGSIFWFTGRFKKQGVDNILADQYASPEILGTKVLIVAANRELRRSIAEQMETWGVICLQADSALTALGQLKKNKCDIALINYDLPDSDAFELSARIKANPETKDTILSLMAPINERSRFGNIEENGFDHCLQKPIRRLHLYNFLRRRVKINSGIEKKDPQAMIGDKNIDQKNVKELPENIRILVAEDNPTGRKVISKQLNSLGYSPVIVSNGREALEEFKKNEFDIVLMDVQMPEMDGYVATSEIRRLEIGSKRTPIAAVTAHALKGEREKCIAAGMDDYISKPLKVKELAVLLDRLKNKIVRR